MSPPQSKTHNYSSGLNEILNRLNKTTGVLYFDKTDVKYFCVYLNILCRY